MKGLILSGGKGSRLRPLTYTRAKQLVPVANKPVLFYGIEALAAAGVRDIGMVVGDTREEIRAAVGDGSRWNVKVTYIEQDAPRGLAHAVLISEAFLANEPFVMYLGDNLLKTGITPFVEEFVRRRPAAQILLTRVPDPQMFGVAELADGQVVRLVEKPKDPKSDLALVGVYMFGPEVFESVRRITPSVRNELEITDAIQDLIDRGCAVHPHLVDGWWKDTGKLDDALASYAKALAIAPDYAEAHYNLGNALRTQGKFEAAVQALQTASEKAPDNRLITGDLIDILNYHMPKKGTRGAHAQAQEALQRVIPKHIGAHKITDQAVRQLYEQCHGILASHDLGERNFLGQFYRGVMSDLDCIRHFVVFDTFKAIPENCFGCFKVSIEPRTVVELFKLMLVFDRLELPNDNTRKCHVEVRPEIPGAYKGLIYCRNLDEGTEILKVVKTIVGEKISDKIPVSVKRGCSEYKIAYPEYADFADNGMTYNEEWREHEAYTDKNLVRHIYPAEFDTHNHSGITLRDAVVMRSWLAYAAAIGDLSYLKIFKTVPRDVPIKNRPPFQPVEDA